MFSVSLTASRPERREIMNNAVAIAADQPANDVECRTGFSVADLCLRWKVGAYKVHGFIRRGELLAVNVATNLSGRPQWRITPESVALFERRRSSGPTAKPTRQRHRRQN